MLGMNDAWHKARTLAAKRLAEFIRSRPDGVTFADLKANGLTTWGLDRLLKLGLVTAEQVREPERGTRAYHWLWKPNAGAVRTDGPPRDSGTHQPLVGESSP
jgi:hypothetical protein